MADGAVLTSICMDLNARLARFDAAVLRVTGRGVEARRERPATSELRQILADLDALLAAHRADLSPRERQHLLRVQRTIRRQVQGPPSRESLPRRLRRAWSWLQPRFGRAAAARRSK